jgi:hypothetical protein
VLPKPVQYLENGGRRVALLRNPEADRYPMVIRCQELVPQMRIHWRKPVRMPLPAEAGPGVRKNVTGGHTRA